MSNEHPGESNSREPEPQEKPARWIELGTRATFPEKHEKMLPKEVDDAIAFTEKAFASIDPLLVQPDANGVKGYEKMLGMTDVAKELHGSNYKVMVVLALKDIQQELKVKADGKFGRETLTALLQKNQPKGASVALRSLYNSIRGYTAFAKTDKLLARVFPQAKKGRQEQAAALPTTAPAEDPGLAKFSPLEKNIFEGVKHLIQPRGKEYDVLYTDLDNRQHSININPSQNGYGISIDNGQLVFIRKETVTGKARLESAGALPTALVETIEDMFEKIPAEEKAMLKYVYRKAKKQLDLPATPPPINYMGRSMSIEPDPTDPDAYIIQDGTKTISYPRELLERILAS